MKTIYELTQEYLNRRNKSQYEKITVITYPHSKELLYYNVSNLKEISSKKTTTWLEFDTCDINSYTGKIVKQHIKINAYINRYVEIIDE